MQTATERIKQQIQAVVFDAVTTQVPHLKKLEGDKVVWIHYEGDLLEKGNTDRFPIYYDLLPGTRGGSFTPVRFYELSELSSTDLFIMPADTHDLFAIKSLVGRILDVFRTKYSTLEGVNLQSLQFLFAQQGLN